MRLRSRTPPERRVPAEPSAPPKAKGTAVKSKAKIVLPQEVDPRGQGEDPPQDDVDRGSPSPYVKEESEDSCYEPIRLRPAPSQEEAQRCLPFPDLGVSMLFRIQLKDAKKRPCSARYLMAASVEYSTKATARGAGTMVKTDLLVVGLGSRKPHRGAVSFEPHPRVENFEGRAGDRAKAFSAHGAVDPRPGEGLRGSQGPGGGTPGFRLLRLGLRDGDVCRMPKILYANSFRAFTYDSSHGEVRPCQGRGEEKCREHSIRGERMGAPGRHLLLLLDGNYWEPYGRKRPHWPGKQKAQGLWSSLSSFTPELLEPFQEMTQRYSGDLESLFLAGHKLMEEMLPEAEFSEACENLLETQVLGRSPDGQLGQWILRDAVVHSLESGHSWTLVPLKAQGQIRSQQGLSRLCYLAMGCPGRFPLTLPLPSVAFQIFPTFSIVCRATWGSPAAFNQVQWRALNPSGLRAGFFSVCSLLLQFLRRPTP